MYYMRLSKIKMFVRVFSNDRTEKIISSCVFVDTLARQTLAVLSKRDSIMLFQGWIFQSALNFMQIWISSKLRIWSD